MHNLQGKTEAFFPCKELGFVWKPFCTYFYLFVYFWVDSLEVATFFGEGRLLSGSKKARTLLSSKVITQVFFLTGFGQKDPCLLRIENYEQWPLDLIPAAQAVPSVSFPVWGRKGYSFFMLGGPVSQIPWVHDCWSSSSLWRERETFLSWQVTSPQGNIGRKKKPCRSTNPLCIYYVSLTVEWSKEMG